jgi:hypothetical protein
MIGVVALFAALCLASDKNLRRLCDIGILCQNIDVGHLTGNFDAALHAQDAKKAPQRRVFVTTVIDSRQLELVPHFIKHYTEAVKTPQNFLFILHGTTRDEQFKKAVALLKAAKTSVVEWVGPFSATTALYHRLTTLKNLKSPDWLIYADLDEFLRFTIPLDTTLDGMVTSGATCAMAHLIDRVSASGELLKIKREPAMHEQFAKECDITRTLLRGSTTKMVLVRGDMRASAGNHDIIGVTWYAKNNMTVPTVMGTKKGLSGKLKIDHYKWTDGVVSALKDRVVYYRDVIRAAWWQESQNFIIMIEKNKKIPVDTYCVTEQSKGDKDGVKKVASRSTLLAQEWLAKLSPKDVPSCMVANTDLCVQYTSRIAKPSTCPKNKSKHHIDKGFADAVMNMVGGEALLEVNARDGCFSYCFGTNGRLQRYNATDSSDKNIGAKTKGLIKYYNFESNTPNSFNVSADWVLLTSGYCPGLDPKRCGSLEHLVKQVYYGMIVAGHESGDWQNTQLVEKFNEHMVEHMDKLGFTKHAKDTVKMRSSATLPHLKLSATLFTKRNLVVKQSSIEFLNIQRDEIQWNNGVSFLGKWFRAYVPPKLMWEDYKIIIGVLSVSSSVKTRQTIRETWLMRAKSVGCLVVFIVNDPVEYVQYEAMKHADILLFEAKDVYNTNSSLPFKTFAFLQMVARYAPFAEWAFKCDDDTFLYPERLVKYLGGYSTDLATSRFYIGNGFFTSPVRILSWARSYASPQIYPSSRYPLFMSGGAGYALSISLVRCLSVHTASKEYMYFPLEDVATRLALQAACEPFQAVESNHYFYTGRPKVIENDTITFHAVHGPHSMYDFWKPQYKH